MFFFNQKENDVASAATGTAAVPWIGGMAGCRVFRGGGGPRTTAAAQPDGDWPKKSAGSWVPPKNARRRRTGRRTHGLAATVADQYR